MSLVGQIAAAEAVRAFRNQRITVQTATPMKAKGDDGKEKTVYQTKDEPLAESHILAACDHGDRIVITTIDGRKHVAPKMSVRTDAGA